MTLTTGQLLAQRYLLGQRIAVGGMGEVWEAADTRLDRQVAVKVLRPELSDDAEFRHRFHTEARMAASLNHPGIAAVHDYGETVTSGASGTATSGASGIAYLVMELVAGDSLATILQRHPRLAADRTLDILRQAAEALQAAHERGLVHRDIKPGNILITPTGQVKLTDFGVAKAVDTAPVTRQGMVMGTAHYIAPEQAAGDQAGPASDVYALGVVGYECLAGRRPFLSDNAVTLAMMHIRDPALPLPPDVPPEARALIEAALAKDPRQRYGTGGEFAAATAAVQAGRPAPLPALPTGTAPHRSHPLPQTALFAPGTLPGPPTGRYPDGYPSQPPHARRRGTRGIAVALLVALGLVLGGIGIREAILRSTAVTPEAGTGVPPGEPAPGPFGEPGTVTPETNDEEPASEESDTEESGTADSDSDPRTQYEPDGVLVIFIHYLQRSGSDAASIATERGLEPRVIDADGNEIDPKDQRNCLVTRVDPSAGWVPVGSRLELTCEEVS